MQIPDVLAAFIGQFYDERIPPAKILVSTLPAQSELLVKALSQSAERKIEMTTPQRGTRRQLMTNAIKNAEDALARHQADSASQTRLLAQLAETFNLDAAPERIEIYDNSHIQGAHAIGAMVVAGREGFIKSAS